MRIFVMVTLIKSEIELDSMIASQSKVEFSYKSTLAWYFFTLVHCVSCCFCISNFVKIGVKTVAFYISSLGILLT